MKRLSGFFRPYISPVVATMARRFPGVKWHREAVGGMWDEIGKLQFDFLVSQGLKPKHRFLDIGCGSLRGGIHAIRYLNEGNYFGIDKDQQLLDAGGRVELPNYGLESKRVALLQMDDFNFSVFNTQFDYALALSLFTHLSWNDIARCVINVEKVLAPGGRFYATFFENIGGRFNLDPISHQPGGITSYFDRDPFHYDFNTFVDICKGLALEVEYIGQWHHPRDQMMMVFRRI